MSFTVKFKTYEDRQKAENQLYDKCGGSVYGGESYCGGYYYLDIYDSCADFAEARRICDWCKGEIQ